MASQGATPQISEILATMRLPCKTNEADEIWSFVYWTWTALDADTKQICSWYVGGRGYDDVRAFMET
jgi:hypothetical protein